MKIEQNRNRIEQNSRGLDLERIFKIFFAHPSVYTLYSTSNASRQSLNKHCWYKMSKLVIMTIMFGLFIQTNLGAPVPALFYHHVARNTTPTWTFAKIQANLQYLFPFALQIGVQNTYIVNQFQFKIHQVLLEQDRK